MKALSRGKLVVGVVALGWIAACASPGVLRAGESWTSPLGHDHPLAGRVWDVRARQFRSWDEVEGRARAAQFVVLGETHDNADHHRLQARIVRAVASTGRRPAVAFEMLDVGQQAVVDGAVAEHPDDPDALAAAVDWAHSGWPAFGLYRPIVVAAMESELPIVAANLSREDARRIIHDGVGGVDPEVRERLQREEPIPPVAQAALEEEMRSSHCGALPETLIDPMVLAQRARNVELALRMEEAADRSDGAILITGAGHARTDRGVPKWVAQDRPDASVVAIAFIEVSADELKPDDYARAFGAEVLPFDLVVFTPATPREDPCAEFRGPKQP